MKKRTNMIFLLITITLLGATLSCSLKENETREITDTKFYIFKPKSILQSIKEGASDIFSPTDDEPDLPPPSKQIPVTWSQNDYWQIANTFHKYAWGETLQGWKLNNMSFTLGCSQTASGFQDASFEFFQNVDDGQKTSRITHFIEIDPRGNSITTYKSEYTPRLVDWKEIDFTKIMTNADDALQLAEMKGGREKRLAVNNECNIFVLFSDANPGFNGWVIGYTTSKNGYIFRLEIDPFKVEH